MRMSDRKVNNNFALYRKIIFDDGVIICPTDTVYGFFASSISDIAAQKVFNLKKRDLSKKLIVNVASIEVLKKYIKINDIESLLINKFWPGQLSIIFNLSNFGYNRISHLVTGDDKSICVRIPNHPQTLELLEAVGIPLISTSVNLSGNTPINEYSDIVNSFKDNVDLILPNNFNLSNFTLPSTIIDARSEKDIKIMRVGSVSKIDIENTINCHVEIS